mgnify:CR=1 FL=1
MASMSQLTMAMITLYSGDPKRIQHFMKVYAFAKMIAEEEQIGAKQREVIEAAALQKDGNVQTTSSRNGSSEDFSDLCMVQAITLEDYNREAKKDETLEDREALVFLCANWSPIITAIRTLTLLICRFWWRRIFW